MIHKAIYNTHPNAKSIIDNEDGSLSVYDQDNNEITLDGSEVAEQATLQAAYDSQAYARSRALEYPPATDYLDGVVKGDQAQVDKYIADCQAVKDKYPKE